MGSPVVPPPLACPGLSPHNSSAVNELTSIRGFSNPAHTKADLDDTGDNSESNELIIQGNMKRGFGCDTLNQTTYSTGGVAFDILCNQYWGHDVTLFVNYTPTFPSCIQGCVSWNSINSDQCVGVDWSYTVNGPNGPPGGSQCRYLFSMNGSGDTQDGEDSARLQPQFIHFPSVISYLSRLTG